MSGNLCKSIMCRIRLICCTFQFTLTSINGKQRSKCLPLGEVLLYLQCVTIKLSNSVATLGVRRPSIIPSGSTSFASWWKEITHRHVTGYNRSVLLTLDSCLFRSFQSQSEMQSPPLSLGYVARVSSPRASTFARFRVAVMRPRAIRVKRL